MKYLKTFIILYITIIFNISNLLAQYTQYSNGVPVKIKSYNNVEGSVFLNEEWNSGMVKTESDKVYKDLYLKYNQLEDQVYYKGTDNESMIFNDPIKEFIFTNFKDIPGNNLVFRSGYPSAQNSTKKSYFQVLTDGNTQFLKRTLKELIESKEFNSATVNRRFVENQKYYLYLNGKIVSVKKDKKLLLAALANKQTELNIYISNNILNLKEESNIIKLIDYFNSINKS
jgi:hypothetical protein